MSTVNNGEYTPSREPSHGMLASLAIAGGVGVLLFFGVVLVRKWLPKYFMPKAYHPEGLKHPPELSKCNGWFNWIPYSLKFPEQHLFEEHGGLDMASYLSFLKFSAILFGFLSILGVASLITNITGDLKLGGDLETAMSNISRKSNRFWVHAISVAVFSFFAYIFVYKFEKRTTDLRAKHLAKELPFSRSVMVEELRLEHANHASLKDIFSRIYGKNQVSTAFVVPDVREAEKLRLQREKLVAKYKLAYHRKEATGEDKKISVPMLCGQKVNACEHYEKEIRKIDEQLCTAQGGAHNLTRTAFVSFNSITSALMAAQVRHDREESRMRITYAPERSDIAWENVQVRRPAKIIRFVISTILIILLFAFWTIPVAFISSFSNIDTISQVKGFSWLGFILDLSPFVRGIITGFLPNLALIIFMALLPTIIKAIFNIRCYFQKSQLERSVGYAYYYFLLLNVFLIVTLAGSATRALNKYIDDPKSIPTDLALSLPGQAAFYFNFVCIHAFINNFIFLMGIPGFIIFFIKNKMAKSEYERVEAAKSKPLPYFKTYSNDLIIWTVGLVYSVMSPVICFAVCVYFCIAFFSVKNYLIFVHKPEYDGIKMNKVASSATVIAIFIFQLTMVGLFGLLVFPPGFIALAMFIASVIFTFWLLRQFKRIDEISPIVDFPRPSKVPRTQINLYKPPAMISPPLFEDITKVNNNEFDIESQIASAQGYSTSKSNYGDIKKEDSEIKVVEDPFLDMNSKESQTPNPQRTLPQ